MPDKDPTASYRTYPKGQNFGVVVALAAIAILILLALGTLFIRTGMGRKADPVKRNQTPNSSLPSHPELPGSYLG